jgi:exopolyphosphatase/guanosine-5'-triphosphate,3'-diphosphate pyrophosphatase
MRVGAIDIGSNSIRLLVADIPEGARADGAVVTVARAGEACRLGKGLSETGRIEEDMAERAADLASRFVRRAKALHAVRTVAAGTAALRTASNGAEVAELIGRKSGVQVRILSGDEEAQLVYRPVMLGLGRNVRNSSSVVFDVGGGSTEVVSGVGERPGRWASLPVGAVSLTEKHLRDDPPSGQQMDALAEEVRALLMHHCAYMPSVAPVLAGVGGTITALAMLDRGASTYDPDALEGWAIGEPRFRELAGRITRTPLEERRRWPAVGEGRADILVAGVGIVGALIARFPSSGLVCSTQGLRYGLARDAAESAGHHGPEGSPIGR